MKKIIVLILLILVVTGCTKEKTYTFNKLPNNYVITKKGELDTKLGKYIDDKLVVEKDSKTIGVNKYIAEFSYGKNYIALKCLENKDNQLNVLFYIIDSINEDVYGPYSIESTYDKVKEKIVDEELSNWIKIKEIEK